MRLGDFELTTISGGNYWIDGGSMFGVVPRSVWTRYISMDDKSRILQRTSCVLVRTGRENVLIDTGYGPKLTEKERGNFSAEPGEPLVENLAAAGLSLGDIDVVVLSHLHFDHAGGATRFDALGQAVPTFPNATYVVQHTNGQRRRPSIRNCVRRIINRTLCRSKRRGSCGSSTATSRSCPAYEPG